MVLDFPSYSFSSYLIISCSLVKLYFLVNTNNSCEYCISGHFLLTNLLLDKLKTASDGARIINITANAYRLGAINFDDLNFDQHEFNAGEAYSQSKLAILLFTYQLAKHLDGKS